MYQKLIIVGNLGGGPELRYTPSGQAVTNFSVATNETWTDATGQRQERTVWWRISVFGKQAEICNTYLQKGRRVLVEGRLNSDPETGAPRLWEKQDGTIRSSFDVTAVNVRFMGGRDDGNVSHVRTDSPKEELPAEVEEMPF